MEIGSLAPIEAVRAQSTVAADQQALTVARTNLQLEQLIMKNALSRTLHDPVAGQCRRDSDFHHGGSGKMKQVQPTEDLVNEALRHRAELVESRIQLNSQEHSNKAVRSSSVADPGSVCLLRRLGTRRIAKSGQHLPGRRHRSSSALRANPNPALGQFPLAPSVGYSATLNQLVNSSAPDKGVGLQLNIPLRNRAAQSVQIRGQLEYRQAQMALAADREPGQHRSSPGPVRGGTEPRQRRVSPSCRGLRQTVAGCRAEEISVRHLDHDRGAADPQRAGHRGIHVDVGDGSL